MSCEESLLDSSDEMEGETKFVFDKNLIGTWQTPMYPSDWGEPYVAITYFDDGRLHMTGDLANGLEPFNWTGTYTTHNGEIRRKIQGQQDSVAYRIVKDKLFVGSRESEVYFEKNI